MGRPSVRQERRAQIVGAFARVLADHGYAGATIAAVAAEAEVAPGLIHHHFKDKRDILSALLDDLMRRFRERTRSLEGTQAPLEAYVDAALSLEGAPDIVAARCWVGIFAEAIREPNLFAQVRRLVDTEIIAIERRAGGSFSSGDAGAVLAFVVGALVVGAFAPKKTAGFAAPSMHRILAGLHGGSR